MRANIRHSALVLLAALCLVGPARADALKVVVFDVEPVDVPQTPAMRDRLKAESDLLRQLLRERGYTIVDTAPQAKKIADNLPLSQCNGCDQDIAKALGADLEVATAAQSVSAATFNLSGSIKDVKSDKVLRQGVVDVRGSDPNVWAHGVKYLVKERLFQPPLPVDEKDLAAAVTAAGKGAD
jgi:hypothetical protein